MCRSAGDGANKSARTTWAVATPEAEGVGRLASRAKWGRYRPTARLLRAPFFAPSPVKLLSSVDVLFMPEVLQVKILVKRRLTTCRQSFHRGRKRTGERRKGKSRISRLEMCPEPGDSRALRDEKHQSLESFPRSTFGIAIRSLHSSSRASLHSRRQHRLRGHDHQIPRFCAAENSGVVGHSSRSWDDRALFAKTPIWRR